MTAVILLLALSGLIGFVIGMSFRVLAIAVSSTAIAIISSAILQIQGFGALPGIAIVVACVAVNQIAYLAGVILSPSQLVQKQIWQKTKTEAQYTACNPHHQQRAPC